MELAVFLRISTTVKSLDLKFNDLGPKAGREIIRSLNEHRYETNE